MSSSSSQRMVHQDYIARIRYSNALPPPPNPPKLLDIPNTGLASGQYTTPGFASRLARDQPLNIEADAELGMPLDLVGMPGVFDGDESSIQAPLNPPPVHPHDRPLLKPLSALGKPKFADTGVSFLRRTEYISSYTSKSRFESTTSRSLINNVGGRNKRPIHNIDKESPAYIKSEVEKSFQIAAQNLKNNSTICHPTKRALKLVECHELLPDLDAFPDAGGYVSIKFLTNPVPPSTTYDLRLESSFLKPLEPLAEEEEAKQAARELHERDPEHYPAVEESMEFEFFMTDSVTDAQNFKRKFDPSDPQHASPDLYSSVDGAGQPCHRFKRIRAYESASVTGSVTEKYDDEIVLATYDGDGAHGHHQKAVYYYPIVQKTLIRPQRTKNIASRRWGGQSLSQRAAEVELERQTDFVDLRVEDPNEELQAARDSWRVYPYGAPDEEEEEDADADGGGGTAVEGRKNGLGGAGDDGDADRDAEGEIDADADADADADGDAEGEVDLLGGVNRGVVSGGKRPDGAAAAGAAGGRGDRARNGSISP